MITYPLTEQDLFQLRILHEKYYHEEFSFPDFKRAFLSTFKILNREGELILAGGVKTFAELILITDKEKTLADRSFGLISALQIGTLVANNSGHELLYACAPRDSDAEKNFIKAGFRHSIDNYLVIG